MAEPRSKPSLSLPVGMLVIGSEMAGFTVLGVLVDYLLGSMPWATVGLTLGGAVAAMIHLRQMVMRRFPPPPAPPAA